MKILKKIGGLVAIVLAFVEVLATLELLHYDTVMFNKLVESGRGVEAAVGDNRLFVLLLGIFLTTTMIVLSYQLLKTEK